MGKARQDTAQVNSPIYGQEIADPTALARIRRERYQRHFELSADQVTGMAKWLVASLFAANSGGILTILNSSSKIDNPQVAGLIFVSGLIFALLSATMLQEIYNRVSDPLSDMIDYWARVESGAEEDTTSHDEVACRLTQTMKWSWVAPALGWLSGVMFVAGAITIALGFKG